MTAPLYVIHVPASNIDIGRGRRPIMLRLNEQGEYDEIAGLVDDLAPEVRSEMLERLNSGAVPGGAVPDRAAEALANRRQALAHAASVVGGVMYTASSGPSPAQRVLQAARDFAAYLDGTEAPEPPPNRPHIHAGADAETAQI